MFNNIIYFIVVLLIFNVSYSDSVPDDSLLFSIAGLLLCWVTFAVYCRRTFSYLYRLLVSGRQIEGLLAERYERLNLRFSVLAILLFAVAIYFFSFKQWLLTIPGLAAFSVVQGLFAIALFLFYLSTLWYLAYPTYRELFRVRVSRRSFVLSNLRFNLPVLFPWLALTLVYDLLSLSPWASSSTFLEQHLWPDGFFRRLSRPAGDDHAEIHSILVGVQTALRHRKKGNIWRIFWIKGDFATAGCSAGLFSRVE